MELFGCLIQFLEGISSVVLASINCSQEKNFVCKYWETVSAKIGGTIYKPFLGVIVIIKRVCQYPTALVANVIILFWRNFCRQLGYLNLNLRQYAYSVVNNAKKSFTKLTTKILDYGRTNFTTLHYLQNGRNKLKLFVPGKPFKPSVL